MKIPEKRACYRTILLILSIAVCLLPGILGSLATFPAIPGWYSGLAHPPFTPPSWVFGPVWTLLYLLMGVSLFLLLDSAKENPDARPALILFAIQLVLNGTWSFVFFGFHAILGGLLCLAALDIAVIGTIALSVRVRRTAGYLLAPYMAWLCIATYLNAGVYFLNGA